MRYIKKGLNSGNYKVYQDEQNKIENETKIIFLLIHQLNDSLFIN